MAQFSHSNIARIYRFFEANGTGFFAMEYECGLSIRERLKEYGHNFSEFEIEAILKPILLGLKELHKKGKIHRDIKPDNIIIRPNGSPTLIDFGAVIDFEKMDPKDIDVIATPDYAPIEQFNPRLPHGPWLDIYSLGATLYEMISGDVPPKSVERLKLDNLKSIKVIGRGKYSDQLLNAIDICLSLNYEERPQSIDQLLALLDFDDDLVLRRVILGLTEKTLNHFLNWAKPNPDIYIDEFISFVICFPIIDLSWRIGRSVPTNELFGRIFSVIDIDFIESCEKQMYKFGFSSKLKNVSLASLKSRFDEYSASYLLDRKEDNWTYEITRKRCTKNCIKSSALDKDQFSSLLEEIIDRARGRIKNNFEKVFRNVTFCITTNG